MTLSIRNNLRQPAILHNLIPESRNRPEIFAIQAADGALNAQKTKAFPVLDPPFNIIRFGKIHPWIHL